MTTTYDPFHPDYFDESDLRQELNRVFDHCHGCRLCFKFCTAFPTLFDFVDRHDDQDVARLTAAEQDQVVDECFQCKLCYVNCPYIPGRHEWALDFPRLMLRAKQVRHRGSEVGRATRLTNQALARTDAMGRLGTSLAPVVNKALAKPGSRSRKLIEKALGISSQRVLAPYAKQRFSTWYKTRGKAALGRPKQADVLLFPTCMVEYQDVAIGQDLVRVCERNGIECSLPEGQVCCGAPFLHQGDVEAFRRLGRENVAVLASTIRRYERVARTETRVLVLQPTCGYVLKSDYVAYLGGTSAATRADAELVANRTRDASEYFMEVHKAPDTELDTEFAGDVPASITYHAPCHLRAQQIGLKSRDLLTLTGARVSVVAECSGIDGTWGLRAENLDLSQGIARKLAVAVEKADSEAIAGDCSLANGGIVGETGRRPVHPIQLLARAYGIEPETRP